MYMLVMLPQRRLCMPEFVHALIQLYARMYMYSYHNLQYVLPHTQSAVLRTHSYGVQLRVLVRCATVRTRTVYKCTYSYGVQLYVLVVYSVQSYCHRRYSRGPRVIVLANRTNPLFPHESIVSIEFYCLHPQHTAIILS